MRHHDQIVSYGPDTVEPHVRAAGYVDCIFKGEKATSLPVQAPTEYDLAINLKTARALGLTVPPSLLVRADELIDFWLWPFARFCAAIPVRSLVGRSGHWMPNRTGCPVRG